MAKAAALGNTAAPDQLLWVASGGHTESTAMNGATSGALDPVRTCDRASPTMCRCWATRSTPAQPAALCGGAEATGLRISTPSNIGDTDGAVQER